jgi:hypothetical protein
MSHVQSARAWAQVIGSLSGASVTPIQTQCKPQPSASHAGASDHRWPVDAKVRVIERVTDCTVTVAWSHSCQGSFGAQVWRESVSLSAQVCALSGDPIARGDVIYKPVRPAVNSLTSRLVILKMHVETLLAAQRLVDTEALPSWGSDRVR